MTKREQLIEYINVAAVDKQIAIHNAYCNAASSTDDYIYTMDELEEVLCDVEKWQLVDMLRFGDFDFMKDFWSFNGYGNLVAFNAWELPIYPGDIADYMLSNEDSLGNDEIENILNDEMEDDDNE